VLAPVTIAAACSGKHVLCEKPLGRNAGEAQQMVDAARKAGVVLKTGFNHRHHPAIWKAHELCAQGAIGPLMFIRAVYGHGGRPGYEKEWRANADLAGGGELLDQGIHIVDLCRWFLGDFAEVFGTTATYVWGRGKMENGKGKMGDGKWKMEDGTREVEEENPSSILHSPFSSVEDNAFALLRTADGRVAQFHTSWTQWKNRFTFEVFGRDGYVRVDGLGGSYGLERLEVGRRKMENGKWKGGAPEVEVLEFPGPDPSWQTEWQEFASAIREGRQPLANGEDGLRAMRLIAAIYESSRTGRVVRL
ncbi:MAG: Gfo/Idh/MocA family oxidoreductase, partial [Anaerolineae bacterium]|nr:Gfo/Idh/MocA family oxidoreductase [Anaerolineae bacterium]